MTENHSLGLICHLEVFHVKPRRTKFITLVYVPGAIHNPKLMLTHSKGPNFVVNAAFFLSSGVIPTSQYALLASSFEYQMFPAKVSRHSSIRDRPFNLKGGGGIWLFVSFINFFRTAQEFEFFFSRTKRKFFFQNLTLGYITKTLNQIIFFSSTKIRIFFSATLGIRMFFLEKKT